MEDIRLIHLPKINDPRGNLSFIQKSPDVPFDAKRCYWIYDVPGGRAREGRALRQTYELIVPLSGSFDVQIDRERTVHLNRCNQALLIPPMHWREIDNFSTNSVALVLASTTYEEEDYIRDFALWQQQKDHEQSPRIDTAVERENGDFGNINACCMLPLPRHIDRDGSLTEVENTAKFPFDLKRVYYLYDVPADTMRGGHAHIKNRSLIVAASGAFTVRLSDGSTERTFHLDRPYQALYVEAGVWRTLEKFSSGSICLVITSEEYAEEDYIRDYAKFQEMRATAADIPFLDLDAVNSPYQSAFSDLLRRGPFVGGPKVAEFEQRLAEITETEHVVAVSNGLDALRLILRAYIELGRLSPGDQVLVPANTYIASVLAITDNDLEPVFVDVSPTTMNMDTSLISKLITPRTKAIMPVHLYGRACWDQALIDAVKLHDLLVVEDNAQAIGARSDLAGLFGSKSTGSLGHAAAFSFYPTKNVGALGDAGAVATHDPQLAATIRALANYGSDRRYHNLYAGLNCRMDPVQAQVLTCKLADLEGVNHRRQEIARMYDMLISNPLVVKPVQRTYMDPAMVWHQYVVLVDDRDGFRAHMHSLGIGTDIHYPVTPMQQPCYKDEYGHVYAPVAEDLSARCVSLPMNTALTDPQIRRIAAAVNSFCPKNIS